MRAKQLPRTVEELLKPIKIGKNEKSRVNESSRKINSKFETSEKVLIGIG